eukprot:3690430-Pyramimonas_sp.AAC.1
MNVENVAPWGPLGGAPEGLLVCSSIRGPLGPSWKPLGALLPRVGNFSRPNKSRDKALRGPGGTRQTPRVLGIRGLGSLKTLRDCGLMLRRFSKRPEDTPASASMHGGGHA